MVIEDGPDWDTIANRYGEKYVIDAFCRAIIGDRDTSAKKSSQLSYDDDDVEIEALTDDPGISEQEEDADKAIEDDLLTQVLKDGNSPRGQKISRDARRVPSN